MYVRIYVFFIVYLLAAYSTAVNQQYYILDLWNKPTTCTFYVFLKIFIHIDTLKTHNLN